MIRLLPTTCQTGMDTGRTCALAVVEPLPRMLGRGGHGNNPGPLFSFCSSRRTRELVRGCGTVGLLLGESLNSFSRANVLQRARTGDGFALSIRVEK